MLSPTNPFAPVMNTSTVTPRLLRIDAFQRLPERFTAFGLGAHRQRRRIAMRVGGQPLEQNFEVLEQRADLLLHRTTRPTQHGQLHRVRVNHHGELQHDSSLRSEDLRCEELLARLAHRPSRAGAGLPGLFKHDDTVEETRDPEPAFDLLQWNVAVDVLAIQIALQPLEPLRNLFAYDRADAHGNEVAQVLGQVRLGLDAARSEPQGALELLDRSQSSQNPELGATRLRVAIHQNGPRGDDQGFDLDLVDLRAPLQRLDQLAVENLGYG